MMITPIQIGGEKRLMMLNMDGFDDDVVDDDGDGDDDDNDH